MIALAYVRAAVDGELASLAATLPGRRAQAAFRAAAALGRFVEAGLLPHEQTHELLLAAATSTGLRRKEAESHIRRGLRRGASGSVGAPRERVSRRGVVEASVTALWAGSVTVTADDEVAVWLRSRGLVPDAIELWDLARVLPRHGDLPTWARTRFGSWAQSGHRLIVRAWDAQGRAQALRARLTVATPGQPKELAPTGVSAVGLVLADPLAVQLLRGIVPDWWTARDVVVCEGVPDFLVWASRQADAHERGPAVFGVASGAWTREIAERVPVGARVVLRTHLDSAGDAYAERIRQTLAGRCSLFRVRCEEGA